MLNFQTLFESIPGLYIVYSLDFVIVGGSDAYFWATKTKREEVVGRHLFEVFPDNPDDPNGTGIQNLRTSLSSVLKYQKPHTMAVQKYDIRRPESEGGGFQERYWTPTNSPIFGENGEMTHIIHRVEDVTEFVQVQQQLNEQRQLNQSLQSRTEQMEREISARAQELQEVNEQVQAANEALSEFDRAKTVFFSNISHEFHTPLTLMLSPIEDLLLDIQAPLAPQQRDRLELVQRNGLRLLKLVNTLLEFSQQEAAGIEASSEPIASNWILPSAIAPSSLPARILLADDNTDMRDYLWRLLSQRYEVEVVTDGATALAAIQAQRPDLILSDLMMPGMDGFELLRQLRADPQRSELPVILLSAQPGEESRVSGLAAGADDYLIKPFSDRELLACIESILKQADIRKQAAQTLQASEQQLKLALKTSKLGSWQFDLKTNVLSVSDQCKFNYGLPIDADFSHQVLMERIHPEDRTWVQAAIQDSITNHTDYDVEYRNVWNDGSTHWVIVRGHPIYDEAGNPERMVGISIDITNRKQAEADLREAYVQWEAALAAGAIYTWRWKIAENLVIVNAAFAHLFGVDSVEAASGLPIELFIQAIHEEDRPQVTAAINQAIETGKEFISEYRVYTAAGEERWLAARGRVEYAADGTPLAFPGALADITERKQAEDAWRQISTELERQLRKFDAIASSVTDFIYTFDLSGRFTYVNQALLDLFQKTSAQTLGKNFFDLDYPIDLATRLQRQIQQVIETRQPLKDEMLYTSAFGTRAYEYIFVPLLGVNGMVEAVAGVTRDITDRKQIEATVKASNERLKLLSEVANDLLLNEDPKVFLASLFEKVSTYLGLEVYFNYLFQEDQQRLELQAYGGISEDIALSVKFLELGQGVCGYVVQHQKPAIVENALSKTDPLAVEVQSIGTRAYACHPLMVGERVLGTLGLGTRQRDHFTRDELDLMQTLANQVAAALERSRLVAELQARAEALDQSNRIKDEFLAVLSHELRTPLNPILGWSKLLQGGKLNPEKTNLAIATIERNAQIQVQLIDDLLDISRILQGKMSLSASPIDLNAVISAALETVRLAAETKSIQIHTTISPIMGVVIGDAGRLQQVVWNLLSNAVKFTPEEKQVTVALSQVENHAQIQITDTGKGIRTDFLPYVFEHFRQEDGATTRKFGGLGLGLAIVRQIVEMHGGTVTVDSSGVGLGATFTVKIPLAPQLTEAPILNQSPIKESDVSGIHILVVDDETDSREFIAFVLEERGAIVTAVGSGTDALQAIAQSIPNIIISDIGMPEMDGYMLMRQIRTFGLEQGGQIPAIALTAYAGELDRQQAIAAGFQRHVPKPIDPEALVAIVVEMRTYSRIQSSEFKIQNS
ncbi:response regulator [Nostoc sp. 'Lobaria pulmonaria (5183) cyanobiont']|uniref:response regulator n=1 Tax=Nostoc sp. 'Lobaria pulmonaria (5183) cyanobiont' TaxID=1618022 RepID=UPI000D0C1FD8|nr:response regulator [Nostoc sp. 'Lobaria pulmonaria (5183) cyanobiont']AVH69614.1 histidine kinase [Nostoc sp. 'Lobaria pulmonaria (5183) cyanobiont']